MAGLIYLSFAILLTPALHAQFQEIGPPPFSKAVAHQRIRALLDRVEPANQRQTIDQLNGLVPWFRDVLDDELISAWQREGRGRLVPLIEIMADPKVAAGVVAFSWRTRDDATFNPTYAPMLAHLMARYAESGREFLSDLVSAPPRLEPLQEETVCRILIDMPDIGAWNSSALEVVLPRYRATAESLLQHDRLSPDEDKRYRAHSWLAQLRAERETATEPPTLRRRAAASPLPNDTAGPILRPPPVGAPRPPVPDVVLPEQVGVVYFRDDRGNLFPLDRTVAAGHRMPGGFNKRPTGQYWDMPGAHSGFRLRTDAALRFAVQLPGGISPASLKLYPLESKGSTRRTKAVGVASPTDIPVTVRRLGGNVYVFSVVGDLPPGEYAFSPAYSNDAFCFGVDH